MLRDLDKKEGLAAATATSAVGLSTLRYAWSAFGTFVSSICGKESNSAFYTFHAWHTSFSYNEYFTLWFTCLVRFLSSTSQRFHQLTIMQQQPQFQWK